MNDIINDSHEIELKGRKNLLLSGVKDVLTFNDKVVELITTMGGLSVRGENIKIQSFNTSNGDMEITGNFVALIYTGDSGTREGFFSKLFR